VHLGHLAPDQPPAPVRRQRAHQLHPPDANLAPGGSGATRTLTITLPANQNSTASGTATITVTVSDPGGLSASDTFVLTVTAVDDAPSFTSGGNVTVLEDSGAYSAAWATAISAGPPDEAGQTVSFAVSNTNSALFSTQPAISGAGVLGFTPAANAFGSATVTVSAQDTGSGTPPNSNTSAAQTFTITVTAVNDAPALDLDGSAAGTGYSAGFVEAGFNQAGSGPVAIADADVAIVDVDDANMESATITLTNSQGDAGEGLSIAGALPAGISATTNTSTLVVLTGSATKATYQTALQQLRYTNASDTPNTTARTVTVVVNDGDASSNTATATITVTATNDAPTVSSTGETWGTIGNTRLRVAAGDPGADANGPYVFATGNVLTNDSDVDGPGPLTASLNGATAGAVVTVNGDGTFSYVPPAGQTTTDTFSYRVTDAAGAFSTGTVTINLSQRVWYVRNNATAGGVGRSTDPFDTLAEAETASAPGDTIYVFEGDGTTTGQNAGITLKANQRLVGAGVPLSMPVSVNGGPNPTVLRAAASQPQIGNAAAGGNGVSVTAAVPIEIVGLNLAGSTNAIDLTAAAVAYTGSSTLTIANNTIRSAGAEGIDINAGGTSALALSLHDNTLTSTGTAIDLTRTAGTLTITAFDDNVVSGNTAGSGIVVTGPASFDASTAGGFQTVSGGVTTIGAAGNGVGGAGMVLTNVTGDLSFTDLDIVADNGAGLSATGSGAFNAGAGTGLRVTVGAGVGVVGATGGPAVSLSTATVDLQLVSVASTNSASTGVSLDTVAGTFSAGAGSSITNATGTDFAISGGTATVTYGGTITDDVGQLVSVSGATGGTKAFTGAITDGNDGDGSGVPLTNNTGATITFSGGLTLSTGANPAFTATGGGTVNATQNNTSIVNTISTTMGTALNVQNSTIGASGLTFRSISAGTAAGSAGNGIVLDNTGTGAANGGLTVTGTGSAASGGTIQHKTGPDSSTTSGIGIYLNNTKNPSFSWMQLNDFDNYAIRGLGVSGFTLSNSVINASAKNGTSAGVDEGSVSFGVRAGTTGLGTTGLGTTGLTGTASVTNTTIEDGFEDTFSVFNSDGTLTLTMDNISVSGSGNDGVVAQGFGTATINIEVRNSNFSANVGDHFNATGDGSANLNVQFGNDGGNTLGGDPTGKLGQSIAIQTGVAWAGTGTASVSNNSIVNAVDTPININIGGTGTFAATVNANTIGASGVAGSGTTGNKDAIRIVANGDASVDPTPNGGTFTAAVTNNTIQQVSGRGIFALARDGGTAADPIELNLTFTGNILRQSPTSGGQGIRVEAGATSTDDVRVHANIGGAGGLANNFQDDWGTNLPNGIDFDEIRITHNFSGTCQFILTGLGANTSSTATVNAYLAGRNTLPGGGAGVASSTIAGGGVYETGGTPPVP